MKPICLFLSLFFFALLQAPAQSVAEASKPDTVEVQETEMPIMTQTGTTEYKGQTITHIIFPTLPKYAPMEFKNEKEREKYNRLVYNIKKVLPWAKLAKLTIIETYDFLETLPDKKARNEHMKRVEAGLKRQYGPALKKLSRSQGRLLLKLIDRECNQTGYAIAKAFMGSFKANLYQGVAVLFGNSLSKKYDPEGDDRYTERVVRMVEAGLL
ncbi:MAG: DUF4294 domain-containing protein [Bacteroidales bacterium]|nr:DUF4294 domain-containing protein [Bacteroidales bacterium]MCI7051186.1 DUF4294 domain-containing protein [Bacteroidales bacterium]